jgi:hypothetical protein
VNGIQIVLICFAVFAVSRVLLRFRRGGLPLGHLFLWLLFWAGVAVVAVLPDTTSWMARVLRVGRGADLVIYMALTALFYILFRMFGRIEDLERQITRVVRAAALKEMENDLQKK